MGPSSGKAAPTAQGPGSKGPPMDPAAKANGRQPGALLSKWALRRKKENAKKNSGTPGTEARSLAGPIREGPSVVLRKRTEVEAAPSKAAESVAKAESGPPQTGEAPPDEASREKSGVSAPGEKAATIKTKKKKPYWRKEKDQVSQKWTKGSGGKAWAKK